MKVLTPAQALPMMPSQVVQANEVKVLGALVGEGIGTEVVDAALGVLRAVERTGMARFDARMGPALSNPTLEHANDLFPREVVEFCKGSKVRSSVLAILGVL